MALSMLLSRRDRHQSDTDRVPRESHDVVNLEALHHLAAMTLHRFCTEVEACCDLSRAVALGDQPKDLDLPRSEPAEGAAQPDRLNDRRGKATEICFQDHVFSACPDTGNRSGTVKESCDRDQRGCGPRSTQQRESRPSVELRQGVVTKDDIGRKICYSGGKGAFGADALSDGVETRSRQLVPDKLSVGFGVVEDENPDWLGCGAGSKWHALYISN